MPYPDGLTDNEKLVRMVASLLDTLRREIVYGDREQAIEKFKQAERDFDKFFLDEKA
jgi:hypothetical protein